MSLRWRVCVALFAVVALFVLAQTLLAYLSLADQEDDLVDELVTQQARELGQRAEQGDLNGPAAAAFMQPSSHLSAWLQERDGTVAPQPLPAYLATLSDGLHRPGRPAQHLHVVIMPTSRGRLFVQYDAEQNEAKVREFGFYLAGLALLCVGLGAALSWRVAGWVVIPIERVTARLTQWAPASQGEQQVHADEEHRLIGAFDRVQNRFEQAIANEREFVANLSHEIRTPLTALRTDLELLAAQTPNTAQTAPQHSRLHRAIAAVDAIAGSVETARNLIRAQPALLELVPLRSCVDEAWASIDSTKSAEPTLRFINEVASTAQIRADRHALLTILRNLFRNAQQHAAGTQCVVRLSDRGIEVTDDGPGIAAQDLPFVFERYYRGRFNDAQAQKSTDNRGLGLAIARQVAELNGWALSVESLSEATSSNKTAQRDSSLKRGTRFILSFHPLS